MGKTSSLKNLGSSSLDGAYIPMISNFFVLISTRDHTTLPFLSLPSPKVVTASPFRKSIATPACALTSGVQDASMPEPHSLWYVSSSLFLNLVSVNIVISEVCLIELNNARLLATTDFVLLLIPPQFLVLNLIVDRLLFTPFHGRRTAGP